MRNPTTWIKLDRNIDDWRWYKDSKTLHVFIHLLIHANIEPKEFKGITIGRGELAITQESLAYETGLSRQEVRTAMGHLISTNDITKYQVGRIVVISIPRYDAYQRNQPDEQPSINHESTTSNPTQQIDISSLVGILPIKDKENEEKERTKEKEDKETEKRIKEIEKERYSYGVSKERTRVVFVPPSVEEVTEYCTSRNNNVDAQMFVDFYSSKGWMVGKNKMKDWKAAVRTWERSETREPKRKDAFSKEFWDDIERNKATDK